MEEITVKCSKCGNKTKYKNWIIWILKYPFHWFGKRRIKCKNCGARTYAARVYGKYKEFKTITFNNQENTKSTKVKVYLRRTRAISERRNKCDICNRRYSRNNRHSQIK